MEVRKTPNAGLGMFATAHIPRGTRLICESPLVVLSELADLPDLYRLVEALPAERAAAFWELAAYRRKAEEVDWIPAIRASYDGPSEDFEALCDRVLDAWLIYETNRFTVRSSNGARNKMGLFPKAARLNHSCRPNVFHRHNHYINRLTIHALTDIDPGTEICTSYIDIVHPTQERRRLLRHWGFKCTCDLCRSRNSANEHRRGKLETLVSRAKRDAAERSQKTNVPQWDHANALGKLEEILELMTEEELDEADTRAEILALAADCALAIGWAGMARDWALQALEIEERCLGSDGQEWEAAKARLDKVERALEAETGSG
ncbi:SET domain-containing protein [Myriangium duriaei CBS 260.36]|uniref:SET domain-containing protein n=1 Tax=Myriangium duriaei CBS 260.36 TaxID=1168546 RepID=A0A9P4MIG6_9PEZI|nr:SET domain-containing protein [Myriangium duriaei CBS 260.36]